MADDLMLHLIWSRTRSAGVEEDAAMCTFHFLTPDTSWPTTPPANYEGAEAAFDAWWDAIKISYTTAYKLNEFRWYRKSTGAALWGPPGRVTPRNVPGSQPGAAVPPQCAVVVTEWTDVQEREAGRTVRHWGRFYLPAIAAGHCDTDGSLLQTAVDRFATETQTLYTSLFTTVGLNPTVRTTGTGIGGLGSHVPVKELRVNNVMDTQRSRKWDTITYQRNIDLAEYWGD